MAATPKRSIYFIGDIDRTLPWLYIALVAAGWLMIYSVNYDPDAPMLGILDLSNNAGKQMLFIIINLALIFLIMMTDWAFWRTYAFVIYLVSLVILPGTLVFGREVNGALAWYQFGGFSFQPSELAKFGTCLALAGYLSSTGVDLREWRSRIFAFLIFMVPVGIILGQSDTGSALVFFSFFLVLYREGLSWTWYAFGAIVVLSVIFGLAWNPIYVAAMFIWIHNAFLIYGRFRDTSRIWWAVWGLTMVVTIGWPVFSEWFCRSVLEVLPEQVQFLDYYMLIPHVVLLLAAFIPNYWRKNNMIQRALLIRLLLLLMAAGLTFAADFANTKLLAAHQQQRIKVWLKPSEATAADARGSAYNMLHSKMAIGSGGLVGKGYLNGNMTNLRYVPAQSTDFIFCTVGEEQGFLGAASVILFFTLFLIRITTIAERQRSNFSRLYAYCIAGIIFVHFIINIGMTMGVLPIIGIPLPFISYGGSSLIGFSLMVGVLLKLDSNRNLA